MGEKLAVLDISESGEEIGKKLMILLDEEQKASLSQYIISISQSVNIPINQKLSHIDLSQTTERQYGDLYFCLEERYVSLCGQELHLTAKEFDILALLILNPKRVFTYEMLIDMVWQEDYAYYSRKAVNNHISNLRRKFNSIPGRHDYLKSVVGVGYKFNINH